ncbi:hypothetical protein PV729_04315 [Streptomyces europaeiscabiei]|uniref:MarR family transcriptional regulator n=1 Tax=Streptomyces europaeiscabiei TaxID=146819 RepID=A0ABU4N6N1_9ACTN|nr:hypothetical protein [Streptomyces europaeiscabiei]MDX3551002.1 hypothetical protein [Streptomyces europaeiscabiei]MDX3698438.1 hypothetical protein [Streptomyces europaeiscabiei]
MPELLGAVAMRAYRKTTRHPFCVYLTAEESAALREEIVDALMPTKVGEMPLLDKVLTKLTALAVDPKKGRS